MSSLYIEINSSEEVLSDKFLILGLKAHKGNLAQIANVLLDRAKQSFSDKMDEENLTIPDLINLNSGQRIFSIFQDFFDLSDTIYLNYNLHEIIDPKKINIEWCKTQVDFLLQSFPEDFDPIEFDLDNYPLLKEYYLVSVLDKNITGWNRDNLKILFPEYFTSSRQGKFYKNRKTSKFLSMKNYLHLLSDFDKKVILEENLLHYRDLLRSPERLSWLTSASYSNAVKALESELDL